jgi:ketosteroid isomerase-like protein
MHDDTNKEIMTLEEELRRAELGPDAGWFERHVADEAVMVDQDGGAAFAKKMIVEAHRPEHGAKFTAVEMRDMRVIDHGATAVVTAVGHFEGPNFTGDLKFMRVWAKKGGQWQIVAGTVSAAK